MSTKLKKIVLESMLASEREVTLNRVAYLMDESWLKSIVDGIIIDATLKNNALSLIKKDEDSEGKNIIDIKMKIVDRSEIDITFRYKEIVWFKTEEDADKYDGTWDTLKNIPYNSSKNETYGFSKESSKVYNTTRRCSIEQASRYCDIELLQYNKE